MAKQLKVTEAVCDCLVEFPDEEGYSYDSVHRTRFFHDRQVHPIDQR